MGVSSWIWSTLLGRSRVSEGAAGWRLWGGMKMSFGSLLLVVGVDGEGLREGKFE